MARALRACTSLWDALAAFHPGCSAHTAPSSSHVALATPHCTGRASIPILKPTLPAEGS